MVESREGNARSEGEGRRSPEKHDIFGAVASVEEQQADKLNFC